MLVAGRGEMKFAWWKSTAASCLASFNRDGTMNLLASSRTALARDVVVDGNHAFVADGLRGLLVYDVSDPAEPSLVGKEWLLGGGWSIAKRGDSVYLASGIYGIQVVDVSDPSAPVWVDNLFACDVVDGVEVGGDGLVAASTWVDGVTLLSESRGEVLGTYEPEACPSDLALDGSILSVAFDDGSVEQVDVTDASNPRRLGIEEDARRAVSGRVGDGFVLDVEPGWLSSELRTYLFAEEP